MSILTGTLTHDGAVVDILVGVSHARKALLKRLRMPIPEVVSLARPNSTPGQPSRA